jgi:VanZ family protein
LYFGPLQGPISSYTCKQIPQLRKIWPLLFALAWFVLTTILLCLPGSALPKENWFEKIWLDKWIHIALFGMLAFSWCRAATTEQLRTIPLFVQIAFYCLLYGIVMEFVQKFFIPNRSFDVGDIFADGVGSILGSVLSIWHKKNRPL